MVEGAKLLTVKDNSAASHPKLIESQLGSQHEGMGDRPSRSFPLPLSITQRLPLLIGTLLFGTIFAITWAAYRGVKDSALEAGHERVRNVTQQLAILFQQSVSNNLSKTSAVANDPTIKAYLHSPSPDTSTEVASVLQKLMRPQDFNSLRIELWKSDHSLVLALPAASMPISTNLETEFKQSDSNPAQAVCGAIRVTGDKLVYPLVVTVKDDLGQSVGRLVRWQQVIVTPEARQRFVSLIGTRVDFYIGNMQGEVWTDFTKIVPKPPVDVRLARDVIHYTRMGNSSVAAWGRPINGTPWFVLVEFSDQEILAQANKFLRRMIIIGLALLAFGLAGALILSRSITRPLRSFTDATSAIAGGDYSSLVKVHTRDELGSLARAFNMMIIQVRESRNELEHKVLDRTAQLEAANRELESFSYSVSHDLRGPLRAMAGFSRILTEEYGPQLPEEAQRYLQTVQDNAQQMGRLIDDLLAFSRLGRQPLNKRPVTLASLLREVLDELHSEQAGRNVEVVISDLPVCLADPTLLKQVLVNLLANALKFTRQKETAVIEIGCLKNEEHPEMPIYFVRDNGAGFDMRYANKLFGVFQRLHRADEYEGTGVGLAIVQRIIRRHGGRIWAEAEVGKGATFYFILGGESYG